MSTEAVARPRQKLMDDAVMAVVLVIFAEAMLFAGLISAFQIGKNSVTGGVWPPPNQPRLPIEATAGNSLALLASGVLLWFAWKALQSNRIDLSRRRFAWALGLGTFFVAVQGYEWVRLIAQGLTMTSSQLGSYFFLIVGTHALHVLAGLTALAWVFAGLGSPQRRSGQFAAAGLFWGFVVLVWPVLYVQVYL